LTGTVHLPIAGWLACICSAVATTVPTVPGAPLAVAVVQEGAPEDSTIAGRVFDRDGKPVTGARVTFRGSDRPGSTTVGACSREPVVTDEGGSFRWSAVKPGDYLMSVHAPGFVASELEVEAGQAGLVIRLRRSLAIRGVVVDGESRKPVMGIPVRAVAEGRLDLNLLGRQTETAEDGSFTISGLDPGEYRVEVGTGHVEGRQDYSPLQFPSIAAGFEGLRIEVTRGLSIAGRIVDEQGRPVPRKYVKAEPVRARVLDDKSPDGAFYIRSTRTDDDGRFRLTGLRAAPHHLSAGGGSPPDDEFFAWSRYDVPAGKEDVEIRLRRGLAIRGRILDEQGKSLDLGTPQARTLYVRVRREGEIPAGDPTLDRQPNPMLGELSRGPGRHIWHNAWFLPDGRFEIRLVVPGATYEVLAFHRHDGRLGRATRVAAGRDDVELRIRSGGTLEGKVLDAEGKPVPEGVPVRASARGDLPAEVGYAVTKTDSEGRFRLSNLHAASYTVSMGGGDSEFLALDLPGAHAPGAKGIEARLRRGLVVEGRIVDRRVVPRGRATSINAWSVAGRQEGASCDVAPDGTFHLRALPAGRAYLQVWVEGLDESGVNFGYTVEWGEVDVPSSGIEIVLRGRSPTGR
jgi:protocatechuate 3,4-dioxygenase beta subunit